MSHFSAVDADVVRPDDTTDEEPCSCGVVHERGLGEQFYSMVEQYGVENDTVRRIITQELVKRGVLTEQQVVDGVTLTRDELLSIAGELAFPNERAPHFDWTAEENVGAFGASAWLAIQVVKAAREVAIVTRAIYNNGLRLHPQHLNQVMQAVHAGIAPLNDAFALQTNVLRPEANVDMAEQIASGIPTPDGSSLDVDGREFADQFAAWAADARAEIEKFEETVREYVVVGGLTVNQAVAVATLEQTAKKAEATGHEVEYDLGGEA